MKSHEETRAMLAEIASAGGCSHPIRLSGEVVNTETGELAQRTLKVACKDRRAVICQSCSHLYKADAWILVAAGLSGGKGVPASAADHPRLFVTLTAPSFGVVHRRSSTTQRCTTSQRHKRCQHGRSLGCGRLHASDDSTLGAPLCVKCFDYRGSVLWNATSSRLWNRTVTRLRQAVGATHGLSETDLRRVAQLNYLKVAELQRRGLVHFHIVIRADGPSGPGSEPPEWLDAQLLEACLRDLVARVQLRAIDGGPVKWGTQFELHVITSAEDDDRRVASYIAKYATKVTEESNDLATRLVSRRQIERLAITEHLREMVLMAWDLGAEKELKDLRLREHAHTLGFAGQLITKSRCYSTTFRELRGARAEFRSSTSGKVAVARSFVYVGRGYDDPDAERLADVLAGLSRELARERAQARRSSHSDF